MAQSARVFVGRPVSSASSLHTFSLATAKFFVVHSKLKRTLANALLLYARSLSLSPSLSSFRICGGVSLAPCSSPRTCLTFRESVIFESVFGSLSSRENERREIAHFASFLRFGAGTRNVRESSRRYPKEEEEEEEEDDPKLVPVLQTQNEREKRKINKKTIKYIRT
jgi:hypothetical protein